MLEAPIPYQFSKLLSGSITAGNPSGREAIVDGGKIKHCLANIKPNDLVTLADIDGPGMIRHIWITFPDRTPETLRSYILRIYWDGSDSPSVLAPIGDFFGIAHGRTAHFSTPYLGVSEGKGFNCFFSMPFSSHCQITLENDSAKILNSLFFQISYTLGDDITPETGRFHAHFRRSIPPKGKNFLMLEVKGTPGVYVGSMIGTIPLEPDTWREGEIRFFIDNDTETPNIVGTGWSDWFLSAWGLGIHQSLYAGSNYQVLHPVMGNKYFSSCFRLHILDPIYFQKSLRVEQSQLGGPRNSEGWVERSDDWCSTVYWYQNITGFPLPSLPKREDRLEGIAIQDWEPEAILRMQKGVDRYDDIESNSF